MISIFVGTFLTVVAVMCFIFGSAWFIDIMKNKYGDIGHAGAIIFVTAIGFASFVTLIASAAQHIG